VLTRFAAREASKRIVEELLSTAGVGRDEEDTTDDFADLRGGRMIDETSPSVVRKAQDFEDESF
jgi:DASH complex subunit ASK1